MSTDIGSGTTVSFGTSLVSFNIVSVGEFGWELNAIKTSHLSTEDAHTYILGRLKETGEVPLVVQHDPDDMPPSTGTIETVTITFYDGTTCEFEGGFRSYKISGIDVEESNLMTANVVVKVSGDFDWA